MAVSTVDTVMKISGKAYPNLFRTLSLLNIYSDEIQDRDGNLGGNLPISRGYLFALCSFPSVYFTNKSLKRKLHFPINFISLNFFTRLPIIIWQIIFYCATIYKYQIFIMEVTYAGSKGITKMADYHPKNNS